MFENSVRKKKDESCWLGVSEAPRCCASIAKKRGTSANQTTQDLVKAIGAKRPLHGGCKNNRFGRPAAENESSRRSEHQPDGDGTVKPKGYAEWVSRCDILARRTHVAANFAEHEVDELNDLKGDTPLGVADF